MTVLTVSLTAAAVAALINIWLGWRVGQVRISEKVLMGGRRQPARDLPDARPCQFRRIHAVCPDPDRVA